MTGAPPTWQDCLRAVRMLHRLADRLERDLPGLDDPHDQAFCRAGIIGARLLADDIASGEVTPTWTTRSIDTARTAAERAARERGAA